MFFGFMNMWMERFCGLVIILGRLFYGNFFMVGWLEESFIREMFNVNFKVVM